MMIRAEGENAQILHQNICITTNMKLNITQKTKLYCLHQPLESVSELSVHTEQVFPQTFYHLSVRGRF